MEEATLEEAASEEAFDTVEAVTVFEVVPNPFFSDLTPNK